MNMDDLLAPSGDNIKLSSLAVGDKLQGVLIRPVAVLPDTDFKTKEQKKSKKGSLLWQFRLNLEIDGAPKTVYLPGGAYWETLNAFKAAGIRSFDDTEGGVWAIKRIDDTPPATAGFAPRKNWQVKFVAAAA